MQMMLMLWLCLIHSAHTQTDIQITSCPTLCADGQILIESLVYYWKDSDGFSAGTGAPGGGMRRLLTSCPNNPRTLDWDFYHRPCSRIETKTYTDYLGITADCVYRSAGIADECAKYKWCVECRCVQVPPGFKETCDRIDFCTAGSAIAYSGRTSCTQCVAGEYSHASVYRTIGPSQIGYAAFPIYGVDGSDAPVTPGASSSFGVVFPNGQSVVETLGMQRRSCHSCEAGSYSSTPGDSCELCAPGMQLTSESGSTSEIQCQCASGHGFRNNIPYCQACVPGEYANQLTRQCVKCLKGTSSSTPTSACAVCGAGSYQSTDVSPTGNIIQFSLLSTLY